MTEETNSANILPKINIEPRDNLDEFYVTQGYFVLDNSSDSSEGQSSRYELGISDEEVQKWRESHSPVLEIGPGVGGSFMQLNKMGVNIYALEPSLKYKTHLGRFDIEQIHEGDPGEKNLRDEEFAERVNAANAGDASLAFPGIKFAAAFALGINFQSYSRSAHGLLNQIIGVIESLKEGEDHFFTFQIENDGSCQYAIQGPGSNSKFQLSDFLQERHIPYDLRKFKDRDRTERTAIRIYNGPGVKDSLANSLNQDIDVYDSKPR